MLIFDWNLIWNKFHIWRPFASSVFIGPFSFNFLMHIFMLYQNSLRYEANPFNTGAGGTSADYLWLILIGITVLSVLAYVFEMAVISGPLLYMIIYVWARKEPDAVISFFGFKVKALYVPWVYVAFQVLMGSSVIPVLMGIGVGHLYYFLVEVLPNTHGLNFVVTPRFCVDFVGYVTGLTQGPVYQPRPAAERMPARPAGHSWGSGRTLGNN